MIKDVVVVSGDLPQWALNAARTRGSVAIDCETTGLDPKKHELCTVQVKIKDYPTVIITDLQEAPWRLEALLINPKLDKIFHYAVFDLGFLMSTIDFSDCLPINISCTKMLTKIFNFAEVERPLRIEGKEYYSLPTSLNKLVLEFIGIDLGKSKGLACSDWSGDLTDAQIKYSSGDVEYLEDLHDLLAACVLPRIQRGLYPGFCRFAPAHVYATLNSYSGILTY